MSNSAKAAQTAAELFRQYGEDADVIATLRAAEVAALGDADALAYWDEVISMLSSASLKTGKPN